MNCEQVQPLLVSYLNHETTPSERTLICAHLSECAACQKEMALLSFAQGQISSALQRRVAHAVPLPDAWERLEARLAQEAHPSPSKLTIWLSRLAPGVSRRFTQLFSGGVTMRKGLILATSLVILAVAMVAVLMFNSATPVSAQAVLDKAYAAQSNSGPAQGIEHIRSENYSNYGALAEDQGVQTILESYADLQSANFRVVTTDHKTGKVLSASAYDGTYTYSQDYSQENMNSSVPLLIYRTPQSQVADLKPGGSGEVNSKDIFDQMRKDPNVQLVGQETWADGRTVYILQSQQQMKGIVKDDLERPTGLVTVYFDIKTYENLGYQMTMEKDGKQLLLGSQKILANETLPAESSVAWNLSDLQGVNIVDDPTREHGDQLHEVVVSPQELAAKTQSGYLLKNVPDGFTLEISTLSQQSANEPYIYIASYRTEVNDYFVIQSISSHDAKIFLNVSGETYATTTGFVMHFMDEQVIERATSNEQYSTIIVEAPDSTTFMITSTLPRETVKAWAEELVLVK